jgi:hypothetical protein
LLQKRGHAFVDLTKKAKFDHCIDHAVDRARQDKEMVWLVLSQCGAKRQITVRDLANDERPIFGGALA